MRLLRIFTQLLILLGLIGHTCADKSFLFAVDASKRAMQSYPVYD